MPHFLTKEAFQFAWQTVRKKLGYWIGLSFVVLIASVVLTPLQSYFSDAPTLSMIIAILSLALALIVEVGYIKIILKTCDNEPTDFPDLFRYYDLSPRYFLSIVLFILCVFLAMIPGIVILSLFTLDRSVEGIGTIEGIATALVLLIPFIFLSTRLCFFSYFIIDQNTGAVESLKRSFKLTQGVTLQLLFALALVFGVVLLGVLALGIGVLVTYPIGMFATAHIYRKLLETQNI